MINKIKIIKGDITQLDCDAIVNAANNTLLGGGGVDGAIHRAAGPELLAECETLYGCATGQAKITKGYKLKVKHVIHTVGPIYIEENDGHPERLTSAHREELKQQVPEQVSVVAAKLKSAYNESLKLCVENNIKSVAFPCISTGVYHYPNDKAAQIAFETTMEFLENNPTVEEVIFCCFLDKDIEIYNKIVDNYKCK